MKKFLTLFAALTLLGSMMTVKADPWTVAGSDATILGVGWSSDATANDMINTSGDDWYLLKANKTLSTVPLEYKVCKDHGWGVAYPGSNASLALTAGTYDVLFKFNSSSHDVSAAVVSSWTVAGTTSVLGSNWNTEDTNNDMSRSGDNWTLTKSHVLLAVGTTYECKVAANHAWDYAFPSANKEFTVAQDGYYDVTIVFNTSTLAVTVTPTSLEPAVPPTPTIALNSNISGSWAVSENFVIAAGDATASLTMNNVAVGSYEFGININSTWTSNASTINRTNPSAAISGDTGNSTFVADIAGDYTFTWTYATNTLSVTYPNMTTATVKFFAPRTESNPWGQVYAFVWNGNVVYSDEWPGNEITSTKSSGWYECVVPTGASVVFSDNNDMQTDDIVNVTADVCYVPTAIDYEVSPKKVSVAVDADCKVEYYIAGTKELIGGAADFDTHTQLDANNQIVFHDVAAGDYAFKISTGSSWVWGLGGNDHLMTGECASIAKTVGAGDVGFTIGHTQDVTITYYPATQKICLGAETTKNIATVSAENMTVYAGKARSINATYVSDATGVQYEILSGSEYISIADGKITGVAAGEAIVRASVAETSNYLGAYDDFTVTVEALATVKVKFYAPKSTAYPWEHVYAYAWIGGDAQSAVWPGDEVSATDGWYEYDVPVGASMLFTDGVAMKTADIAEVAAATCYVPSGLDRNAHEADESEMIVVNLAEQCALDYYIKNNWNGCDWTWEQMTAAGDGTYRLENVVYGGNGVDYNIMADGEGAQWKEYSAIKYADNKVVTAYDTVNFVLDPATGSITAESISKDTAVYTVASNSLSLCDLGWAATHPYKYTDMTKQEDGTYQWTKGGDEVTLPAGVVELKVIKNRDYANGNWPDGENFQYNIQRSGEYKITVTFNPCTKAISIDTILVTALNIQGLELHGSWNGWAGASALTLGGDNDKALATLHLEAGNYTFKLKDGQDKWYGDGQSFTRANASQREIKAVDEGANMSLNVDKDGDYLFTYIYETEQLVVSYPANVPATKIAPLSGKFTINAKGDTAVFARGNLQYNYESSAWYAAEKQYEVLGDLNLRFGDNTYKGSIDLFSWSCESSNFGLLQSSTDGDFTGDFVDWGQKFADDEKEWGTLSLAEWQFLLGREKGGHSLWTMIALAVGPDTLNGIALFPDDWTAPSGLTIKYGFYNLDNEEDYLANSFSMEQWEAMEDAGVVFLPLGGTRAGHVGFISTATNPLTGYYCWVDNTNWMGYYWLSTAANETQTSTIILPGWHNNAWTAPTIWSRERRRGQSVRLVTRIPKNEFVTVRDGLTVGNYGTICLKKQIKEIRGASLWSMTYRSTDGTAAYLIEETDNFAAGKPFIFQATADKLEVLYEGEEVGAPIENGALRGTFAYLGQADLDGKASDADSDIYLLSGNKLWNVTTTGASGNSLNANRAYIVYGALQEVSETPQAPGKRVRAVSMTPQVATGMDNVQGDNVQSTKVLINGQLFILRGEKMYDVTGRLVK